MPRFWLIASKISFKSFSLVSSKLKSTISPFEFNVWLLSAFSTLVSATLLTSWLFEVVSLEIMPLCLKLLFLRLSMPLKLEFTASFSLKPLWVGEASFVTGDWIPSPEYCQELRILKRTLFLYVLSEASTLPIWQLLEMGCCIKELSEVCFLPSSYDIWMSYYCCGTMIKFHKLIFFLDVSMYAINYIFMVLGV